MKKQAAITEKVPATEEIASLQNLLLQAIQKSVPGSVSYEVKRYRRPLDWASADMALLSYRYQGNNNDENRLELKFCVSGNFYCREKHLECDLCKFNASRSCVEKIETVDWISFTYSPGYLMQFAKAQRNENALTENVINFSHHHSFDVSSPLNTKTRTALDAFLNHNYTDTRENIFINAQTQIILLYATESMLGKNENDHRFSKFLQLEEDREKIIRAREILLDHIGHPLTIKALSRKVAINECYLKKGFKEIFGTTIFDFYQGQRMEHAKYLLYEKGMTVTEVSASLGYSSISHFSTAFKKHTGLKPCELLVKP